MSNQELIEWASEKDEHGIDRALSFKVKGLPAEAQPAPFSFPFPEKADPNAFSLFIAPDANSYCQLLHYPPGWPNPGFLDASQCDTPVYPRTPHLSLTLYRPSISLLNTLAVYNGFVRLPLRGVKEGSVTLSFGTQIWPNDRRVTFAWVSNLDIPREPRLAENQVALTDRPIVYSVPRNDVGFDFVTNGPQVSRNDYLTRLRDAVNKPVMVLAGPSAILQQLATFNEAGTYVGDHTDARIEGVETDQQFALQTAVADAYLRQDFAAFDAAIESGVKSNIFFTPDAYPRARDLTDALEKLVAPIEDLDSTFAAVPYGIVVFMTQSERLPLQRAR